MLAGRQQWSGKYLSCEWQGPVVPHNGWNVSYVAVPIQSLCVAGSSMGSVEAQWRTWHYMCACTHIRTHQIGIRLSTQSHKSHIQLAAWCCYSITRLFQPGYITSHRFLKTGLYARQGCTYPVP